MMFSNIIFALKNFSFILLSTRKILAVKSVLMAFCHNKYVKVKVFVAFYNDLIKVFVRTLIEALFIAGYFYLYVWKWIMPETYQCNREPCNDVVTCYVERPKQKTIVIWIMFATGCITVLVGLMAKAYKNF